MESAVLFKSVQEAFRDIGEIEALVLTSFGLDVDYFETMILPAFFPHLDEGPVDEPHLPLFEYLEENPALPISVLFDADNLIQGNQALRAGSRLCKQLRWQAHPLRGTAGVFHPKLFLALVRDESGSRSLVLGCSSANLTKAGWSRNLEAGVVHTLPIRPAAPSALMADVARVVDHFCGRVPHSPALAEIQAALAGVPRLQNSGNRKYGDKYYPRLWFGAVDGPLMDWLEAQVFPLQSEIKRPQPGWNVELISPYFSEQVPKLVEEIAGQLIKHGGEGRLICRLPEVNGQIDLEPEVLKAWSAVEGLHWGRFTGTQARSQRRDVEGQHEERFVHAKIIRFWSAQREFLVIGSANATIQGHRDGGFGNDEACFVFGGPSVAGKPFQAMLSALDQPPLAEQCRSAPSVAEDRLTEANIPAIDCTFDWKSHRLRWRYVGKDDLVLSLGARQHFVPAMVAGSESEGQLGIELDAVERAAFVISPTVRVHRQAEPNSVWVLLAEELHPEYRPPAPRMERRTDDLLRDWLLSAEDRVAEHLAVAASEQRVAARSSVPTQAPLQHDRLNDVFLAMQKFRLEVEAALDAGEGAKIPALRARVFGQGAMSIRYFLSRVQAEVTEALDLHVADGYLMVLCIRDAVRRLSEGLTEAGFEEDVEALKADIAAAVDALREPVLASIQEEGKHDREAELLTWVEEFFHAQAAVEVGASA